MNFIEVILNGHCCGCRTETRLYRVPPSEHVYRCAKCYRKQIGYGPSLEHAPDHELRRIVDRQKRRTSRL